MAESVQPPLLPSEPREEALPKLSMAEYTIYNSMADGMNAYHNRFRQTWTTLHNACANNKRPANLSLPQFLSLGLEFCHHLHIHHTIEEEHIFPVLATKMPAFREELELLTQHKQIHKGLDVFQKYLAYCKTGRSELRMEEMKELMDAFGKVLWQHLDDEVEQLGAENMRKYWSIQEMRGMPM
ncbi:MAG: hypothetical protein M1835_002955 [Candelina submexicana]|nr:MAG: hypothetical protein M1835_002955 [Candelina submexicana]